MSGSAPDCVFNADFLDKVQTILRECSVHRASISFRSKAFHGNTPATEHNRTLAWETREGELHPTLVGTPTDTIFHIASITKVLVGTAIAHAIEVKAEEAATINRWAKFKGIQAQSIRDVYNRFKGPFDLEMGLLPGNPTIYELLVHSLGLPSYNDFMFAPDGTPLMERRHLLKYLPSFCQEPETGSGSTRWTSYSNMNFAIIALLIDVCWDGDLKDFMKETLFDPLELYSTSIGLPPNRTGASSRWTVDQDGTQRSVQIPDYRSTGAEAAALGAYSTTEDLDTFFSSVINAAHGIEPTAMKGFSKTIDMMLRWENHYIGDILNYTPFGLETKLSGSTIGFSSTSGLQFAVEPFTQYAAVPGALGETYTVHYMAGSAVGCSCATALKIDSDQDFAITVLTDTSGPVAVADHILRLVLRRCVDCSQQLSSFGRFKQQKRESVRNMVTRAKKHTIQNWNMKDREDRQIRQVAHPEPFTVLGTYNGCGVPQKLHVVRRADGKLGLTVCGGARASGGAIPTSQSFELLWKDDTHLWLCVPPYMSIDRLDNGDWSNMLFEVTRDTSGAVELRRRRTDGTEVRYTQVL